MSLSFDPKSLRELADLLNATVQALAARGLKGSNQ